MQIRHLRNSKIITEILILCVAYISMAAGVYIGIAGNDTSKAYYSLIVIIPAIVTYRFFNLIECPDIAAAHIT